MNETLIEQISEMNIFSNKTITEEEYRESSDSDKISYISGCYENGDVYYKQIDTHGMTDSDVKIALQIRQARDIRQIKYMILFLVIITIIGICIAAYFGMSTHNYIENISNISNY